MLNIKTKLRRAFTIVELVVVIAVIAALAAILIPTFANVISSANESADTSLVKNLNTILTSEEALNNGQPSTMGEALEWVENNGYKVENLTPASSGDILWNQETNSFLLVNSEGQVVYADSSSELSKGDTLNVDYTYWYVVNDSSEYTAAAEKGYSLYINTELEKVEAKGGVEYAEGITSNSTTVTADATSVTASANEGKTAMSSIKTATAAASSTANLSVIIKTNGGTLSVEVTGGTAEHYGTAESVTVNSGTYSAKAEVSSPLNVTATATIVITTEGFLNGGITADFTGTLTITVEDSATTVAVLCSSSVTLSGDTSSVQKTTLGDGETISSYYAMNGTSYYKTLKEAVSAASSGDTITLLQDLSENCSLIFNNNYCYAKSITIDLNTFILKDTCSTTTGSMNLYGDNTALYLKNGTFENSTVKSTYAIFGVQSGASITFDNMDVNATGSILYPNGTASKVNVYDSTLYTTGVYCVATNSATVDNYNVIINLENSTFTTNASDGDSCTVMINVAGTLNITDCVINGQKQAVLVRAGIATITNTTINCVLYYTASDKDNVKGYSQGNSWSGGNNLAFGAVVVGDTTSGSYNADAYVKLTGCTISCTTNDSALSAYTAAIYATNQDSSYKTTVVMSGTTITAGNVVNVSNGATISDYSGTIYTTWSGSTWTK